MKSARLAFLASLLCACASSSPPPAAPTVATATAPEAPAVPPAAAAAEPAAPPATAAATPPAPAPATPAPAPAEDALVGKPAPDFTAKSQAGKPVHISALKGKNVVVYFYPKDETAGCTKEACSFRDAWDSIAKTGAVLIGISADNADSHKHFAEHHKLPFLLVSDPDGSIAKLYGVGFEGHHHRETIVIGADGNVRKVYRQVDVGVHAQQILEDLQSAPAAHASLASTHAPS
ncbi:MAG TPA: peroxiredoxin [Polyangiaceae bacterium]|jgi:peroxiredoxin Q/BCP